jgi:hypothetical protein
MSKTALVRLKDNKEIVGFFVYSDLYELFWLIDECTDPYQCEYKKISSGGFMWPKPNAQVLMDFDSEIEDEDDAGNWEHDFDGADVTGALFDKAFSNDGWTLMPQEYIFYSIETFKESAFA